MKRVGIITMHKVPNFGSALQAYALQNKITLLGFNAELIDYLYPNKEHCSASNGTKFFKQQSLIRLFIFFIIGKFLLFISFNIKKNKAQEAVDRFLFQLRFRKFYKDFFKLSKFYDSANSLQKAFPKYDIYFTGSDQVWNSNYIVNDSSFLLGFVPDALPKYSYAASFSCKNIPENYEAFFKKYLVRYNQISVREKSSANIVSNLILKHAEVVCDPTLLLNKNEWFKLCKKTSLIKNKYLLVYILDYAYNPYPNILKFIDKISAKENLQIVEIYGLKQRYHCKKSKIYNAASPIDFLSLFRDAEIVITTSFHGTAFALNFEKKFYSVVENVNGNDNRIVDLLKICNAEHHLVEINNIDAYNDSKTTSNEIELLEHFRKSSLDFLKNTLC